MLRINCVYYRNVLKKGISEIKINISISTVYEYHFSYRRYESMLTNLSQLKLASVSVDKWLSTVKTLNLALHFRGDIKYSHSSLQHFLSKWRHYISTVFIWYNKKNLRFEWTLRKWSINEYLKIIFNNLYMHNIY